MPDDRRSLRDALNLSTLGFTVVICIALGAGAGYWADKRFGTEPAFTVVGFLLGTVAAFREIFRASKPR